MVRPIGTLILMLHKHFIPMQHTTSLLMLNSIKHYFAHINTDQWNNARLAYALT
jgi:hypothetical protein